MTADDLVNCLDYYSGLGRRPIWGGDVRTWATDVAGMDSAGDIEDASVQAQREGRLIRIKTGSAPNARILFIHPTDAETLALAADNGWVVGQVPPRFTS
jgi:hypothetical protein